MSLSVDGELRRLLKEFRLNPKKGLGQHFLCDAEIVGAIVAEADGAQGVLEIGPGPGILTQPLSESHRVTAVELDRDMVPVLLRTSPAAHVVHADALSVDWSALLVELPGPRAIVSNMPYQISAPLLAKCAGCAGLIDRAVLMMQEEVATKVMAKPGMSERGSLSVFMQAAFEISVVVQVSPIAFMPPPKVNSTVLRLNPRPGGGLDPDLNAFIRKGFSQPRKTLLNNLLGWHGIEREAAGTKIEAVLGDARIRPHFLTLDQWQELYRALLGL